MRSDLARPRVIGGPCSEASHEAMKRDPAAFARYTVFAFMQPTLFGPPIGQFHCLRCLSTISAVPGDRFEERAACRAS